MAVRLLTYVGLLYQHLVRSERPAPSERLPPVLPLVLYNGEEPWWARTELSALLEEGLPGSLADFQPQLRYLLLDEGRLAEHPLPTVRNLAAALFGLENSRTPAEMATVLALLAEWLRDPAQASLRRAFTVWLNRILLPRRLPEVELPEALELQEMHAMLAERVKRWTEEWEQRGVLKGIEQGIERGRNNFV